MDKKTQMSFWQDGYNMIPYHDNLSSISHNPLMLYHEQIAMGESIVLHYKTSYIICFTLKNQMA